MRLASYEATKVHSVVFFKFIFLNFILEFKIKIEAK